MNKIISFIFVILFIFLGITVYFSFFNKSDILSSDQIRAHYSGKFVYQLTPGTNIEFYRNDCEKRKGIFNECGNDCAPDAKVCDLACAITCEKIPE